MKEKGTTLCMILIANLSLTFHACESIIEFRGGITEPKIVLYSVFQPDSLITATISKSYPITDYKHEPEQIPDAVVRLFCDGELVETLNYVAPQVRTEFDPLPTLSKYVSYTSKPVYGSTYRLEAAVEGMKTVSGETTLPGKVPILGVDTSTFEKDNSWERPWIILTTKIKIADPKSDENFYMLQMKKEEGRYEGNPSLPFNPANSVGITISESSFDNNYEPLLSPDRGEDQFGLYPYNSFNIFNDKLISGSEYILNIKIDYFTPDTNYYEFIHFQVQLHSISRELYLYLESYSAHMQTRDQFFSEPVVVYSNIENGLGIVGARITSFDTIRIGRYPVSGVNYRYDE